MNTTFSTCNAASFYTYAATSRPSDSRHSYCRMNAKWVFVEATVIITWSPVTLLRKPRNGKCPTCGHFRRGDGFCDRLIFSFSGTDSVWTCFAEHQRVITCDRGDGGRIMLVTTIWDRARAEPNDSLTCLVRSGSRRALPSRLSSGATSGGQPARIWPRWEGWNYSSLDPEN